MTRQEPRESLHTNLMPPANSNEHLRMQHRCVTVLQGRIASPQVGRHTEVGEDVGASGVGEVVLQVLEGTVARQNSCERT